MDEAESFPYSGSSSVLGLSCYKILLVRHSPEILKLQSIISFPPSDVSFFYYQD